MRRRKDGSPRRMGLGLFVLGVLTLLYAPIVLVLVQAFNADPSLTRWGGATTRWFSQAASDPAVTDSLSASFQIALLATCLSVVIAVSAALYARRGSSRRRTVIDTTTYMRIALPEIVSAVALFVFFRRLDVELGMWTVVAGHVVFTSAYATLVIQARLATMSPTLEAAAADLGASPRRAFQRVTMPLLMPAIIVAALFAFSFSFDDVVTSSFLAGTNTQTLPMQILGRVRFTVTPEVNAIGVGVMLVTLATLVTALAALALSGSGRSMVQRRRTRAQTTVSEAR